ncbi:hypothetical protein GF358_03275 [Candidatus Woesearchaeota archaeon]|nr:hypothetical protein [Candidatus Woesearchaeota archaeon]
MMINSISVKDFNLQHTLECGQFFRFVKHNGWYYIGHRNKLFKVKQKGNRLLYSNITETFLKRFFNLDFDYDRIFKKTRNKHISKARNQFKGLRLIKQDPWECLISYVCSANNNIPKIKKMIAQLCKEFGRKVKLDEVIMYSFPAPGKLNSKNKIKNCVYTGVKTKSILEINKKMNSSRLNQLKKQSYQTALNKLTQLYGVGPKIANCVMLFSLDFLEAVPVDIHMKKVLVKKYSLVDACDTRLTSKAMNCFGKYGGIFQQYLFYQQRIKDKD